MPIEYQPDHIHLRSTDPVAAARFYVNVLQAKEVGKTEVRGELRVVVALGAWQIFIQKVPESTPRAPAAPFLGIEHIALSVKDLTAAAADLQQRNVRFVSGPKQPRPGFRSAVIEGPDGVLIELLEHSLA